MTDRKPDPVTGETATDRIKRTFGTPVEAMTDKAATAVRAGVAGAADDLAAARTVAAEKGVALVRSGASGIAAGISVASERLTGFAENLDWSTIDPTPYLYAGTRGVPRSLEEARLVWESIPEQLRALGPEEVGKRLDGFDWSHIVPHNKGGGNEAANGIFEFAGLNRSRGAEEMTGAEIEAAAGVLSETAFVAMLTEVASHVLVGGAVGAAVACVVKGLEYGLAYQRGEITQEEMYRRWVHAVAASAVAGAAISGVIVVVALAFPALIPLAAPLMMPLAVLGFCAVGGKVVGLGQGWYQLYREGSGAQNPDDMLLVGNRQNPKLSDH